MSHETHTPSATELTRKEKLIRRFLPLVLLLGGTGAGVAAHEIASSDKESSHEGATLVQVHVNGEAEFGGADSDWEHGTAESLIKSLIDEGLADAAIKLSEGVTDKTLESAKELPIYTQANTALEMAENGTIPDEGDVLTIGLDLSVNANDTVTYVVTEAKITDKLNNR